ncbi:hypothetical protein OPKNFCMD_4578 [Methylobacterium crusticola]|uniref:Uncharacterized protein n=1 Tax=Methylobacterium crusticola TaxID=1697972 RepID=A0ABQ4R3T6_9HYPH|nr:hypothetical protein [Methylobacterium crusticola]GJD51819.1 hypothetical protein OPKNFCMD_4578 [Methylobacterium crusticola]
MTRSLAGALHDNASRGAGITRLPNGLDLHAPPVAAGQRLLPRRFFSPGTVALLLLALAGWTGLLAWTRTDPAAPGCAAPAACAAEGL